MTVSVNASKKYDIVIEKDLSLLAETVLPKILGDRAVIITDSVVDKLYADKVISLLSSKKIEKIVIKSGEASKNAQTYFEVLCQMASLNFSRKTTVIALGGGVVGDLAGFISATYMRGVGFIQIPTTLLAMVDSSVGGKTAIDLPQGKNLVGAFYQPDVVYVCTEFLKTLPQREITSGMGEILKYAFIDGRISPKTAFTGDVLSLIETALKIKRDIVERDEKESGERMLLNFGHTVGHAIEQLSGYALSHGECVIKGAYYSLALSNKLGYLSSEDYASGVKFLEKSGVNKETNICKDDILQVINKDKKATDGKVNFVLTSGFGKAFTKKIDIQFIKEVL